MKKTLNEIRAEIAAVDDEATRLCEGLTEEQLRWRPQPGKWSIAENIAHLNMTTQTYLPGIQRCLQTARERRMTGSGAFDLGFTGKLFVRYLEPPFRVKTKAPKAIRPVLQGPATEALPQFLRGQEVFRRVVDSAEGLDLGRVVFVSQFASILRMKLMAAFATVTAHDRRHLWIIQRIREQMANHS